LVAGSTGPGGGVRSEVGLENMQRMSGRGISGLLGSLPMTNEALVSLGG